jgi:hypothetical protein
MRALMRQQKEGRWLAWHSGLLGNFRKAPSLEQFVGGGQTAPKPQTPEQMQAIAERWSALTPAKGERRSRS